MPRIVHRPFNQEVEYWKFSNFFFNVKRSFYFHTAAGEKLVAQRKFDNQFDKFSAKLLNGEETVGHLPRECSRLAVYFVARCG